VTAAQAATAARTEATVARMDPTVARRRGIGVDPALLTPTPDQEELRGIVARFLTEVSGEEDVRRHAALPAGFDPGVWRRLTGELGVAGIAVPERHGGAGSTFGDLAVVLQEAGRRLLCAPLLPSAVLGTAALLAAADEAACERYLPGIADGSTVATLAGTGGPHAAGDVRGHRAGDGDAAGWRLSGAVDFVLHGACADVVLVPADTAGGPTLFAVDGDAEGLSRTPRTVLDATRPQALLRFADVPARAVGAPGAGAVVTERAHDVGRAALAAEQVGATEHALRACVAFVAQRHQFGRPIGSFQAIKHRLADLLVELEGARSVAGYAAACVDAAPAELPLAAAVAQVACGDALELAAREYVQLHGGVGFTWEHPAHLYVRRARGDAVLFGTVAGHRSRVADLIGLAPATTGPEVRHG
jgi:alkylation response protein AidB-like acyl-CoA dehydrogenase